MGRAITAGINLWPIAVAQRVLGDDIPKLRHSLRLYWPPTAIVLYSGHLILLSRPAMLRKPQASIAGRENAGYSINRRHFRLVGALWRKAMTPVVLGAGGLSRRSKLHWQSMSVDHRTNRWREDSY